MMSDTPIYDALAQEFEKRTRLNLLSDILRMYTDSIETRYFELMDEDVEEVPALLANAAKAVGNLLIPTLVDRQDETETDREFAAYVGGILDTLDTFINLPLPDDYET